MDGEYPEDEAAEAEAVARSLQDDLRLLARDAKALASAEFAYQKSRASVVGGGIGKIVGLGLAAVLFAFAALIALVVGLLIALIPLLTAWGATAAVTLVMLLLALAAALWAKACWARLSGLIFDEGPQA